MLAISTPTAGADLSDTALRRMLRRIVPFLNGGSQELPTHSLLMEESERRLSVAACSTRADEKLVANRILDSPRDFRRWEDEHAKLMRRVVDERRAESQKLALLLAALALVHRKELFEYLREHKIRGNTRKQLLAQFHGTTDYATSIIAEHGNYVRSAASYMCSRHVGQRVLVEALFGQPLRRYESVYKRYFDAFCGATLARTEDDAGAYGRSLLVPLKQEVNQLRIELLGCAHRSAPARKTNAIRNVG